MKKLNTALMLSFVLLLNACSTTRAPSINFLEMRSDYDKSSELKDLNNTSSLFVPNRTKPQEVDIFVHPHETVHGDYFQGGFVRSVVQGSQWDLSESTATPPTHEEVEKDKKTVEVTKQNLVRPIIHEFGGGSQR